MRKALRILAVVLSLTLIVSVAQAAVKAGTVCAKLGATSTVSGKKYTCIKSGKKLVWDKGVAVAAPKPTSSPSASATPTPLPTQTTQPFIEGHDCPKMGLQGSDATGLLECRHIVDGRLVYTRINNDVSPVQNPDSPDSLLLCQLSDLRTQVPNGTKSIAYPPQPFPNFKASTGTFKVVVVGIDFSDVPGTGSPSAIWKDDLVKATDWLKWYTHDKVKLDFVTYPNWIRVPKTSGNYDASNNSDRSPGALQAGGLTVQQINDDYVHAIEGVADLSNTTSIWVYMPLNITKIDGGFQPQTVLVQSQKYGLITSQLVAVGADTYLSRRVRWGYFLHEMFHGWGMQGHSPKYIPTDGKLTRLGEGSTADGWTNALLPWDALVWGVAKPSDVFCIDKPNLKSVDLKLVPLEREQEGIKSAMVKINEHQVLLVESHRSDKWGVGEGPGFAGVMVAIIDTTVSTAWDNEVTPKDPCITSTGVYLRVPSLNHGSHQPIGLPIINNGKTYIGAGLINGMGIAGDYEYWDLNHIMYTGESISAAGLKVTLVKGGDNDTIRVENIDRNVSNYVQPLLPAQCLVIAPTSPFETPQGITSLLMGTPTKLQSSINGQSVILEWVTPTDAKLDMEYFRIKGECLNQDGVCGTYLGDLWGYPKAPGSSVVYRIPLASLSTTISGSQWSFSLTADNQSTNYHSFVQRFSPVIFGP
jgi:hypothetical protein